MLFDSKATAASLAGVLSNLTQSSKVRSPVIDKEVLSAASNLSLSVLSKSTAVELSAKGKLVLTSVAPVLVKVLALAVLSFKSIAVNLPSFYFYQLPYHGPTQYCAAKSAVPAVIKK